MLAPEVDHELRVTRNSDALDVENAGVDPAAGTATYRFRGQPLAQRLVFHRPRVSGGARVLRVTWADGEPEALVRPLDDADRAAMAAAYERGPVAIATAMAVMPRALVECGSEADFRSRAVCGDHALRALDEGLARDFHLMPCAAPTWNPPSAPRTGNWRPVPAANACAGPMPSGAITWRTTMAPPSGRGNAAQRCQRRVSSMASTLASSRG